MDHQSTCTIYNYKTSQRKPEGKTFLTELAKDFLDTKPKAESTKNQIGRLDFIKVKCFFPLKDA